MMTLLLLVLAADPIIVVNPRNAPVWVGNARDGGSELNVYVAGQAPGAGGLTDTELRATAVPVSIASVPSHAVTLASTTITGSVAVTGSFYQETQPVSGSLTCDVGTVPVTGAFWQATQPVSIASMPTTAVTMADRTYSHRAVAYAASPTPIAAAAQGAAIGDLEGRQYVNTSHPRAILCNLSTTATTSTQVTGCELVASNSIWITSITVGGGVATGATAPAIIQSGTSTGCTGPVVLYRCGHVAQSTCTISFPTPIKATAAHGICLLDATVGTKWVTITGYVAP